jgi:hypothetical protein
MTDRGKKITAIIVISSVVLIGAGIGLYYYLRKPKDDESTDESIDSSSSSSSSGKCVLRGIPTELKDKNGVIAFQTWLDERYPYWHLYSKTNKYTNVCKATTGHDRVATEGCGSYGCQTQGLWDKYKDEYLKSKS